MTSLFPRFGKALAVGAAMLATPLQGDEAKALKTLLAVIRAVEAPAGYDDYYRGVSRPPPALLTTMSIRDVLAWQDAIDPHSISEASGGYQIMEDTLRELVVTTGIDPSELYAPATQDYLAQELLTKAGWHSFQNGTLPVAAFGDRVAKIWAGLPLLTGAARGQSAYHGIAGNRALISADTFEHVLTTLERFDVASLKLGTGNPPQTAPAPVIPKSDDGFAPSIVITWTSDPFYQD